MADPSFGSDSGLDDIFEGIHSSPFYSSSVRPHPHPHPHPHQNPQNSRRRRPDAASEDFTATAAGTSFELPGLPTPVASFGASSLPRLGAFQSLFPQHPAAFGLATPSEHFGATPRTRPGASAAATASASASSATPAAATPHPRLGAGLSQLPTCPAHPAFRSAHPNPHFAPATAFAPRHGASAAPVRHGLTSMPANTGQTFDPYRSFYSQQPQPSLPVLPFPTPTYPVLPLQSWTSYHRPAPPPAEPRINNDDYFLDLLNRDFSDPSIFADSPQGASNIASPAQQAGPFTNAVPQSAHLTSDHPWSSIPDQDFADLFTSSPAPAGDMSTRRASRRNQPRDEASSPPQEISGLSFPAAAPATAASRSRGTPVTPKKEPLPATGKRKRQAEPLRDRDFFDDDIKVVDLVDTEEVPESVSKPKKRKNEVRLGCFQCVICMDDVKSLTVTHCGHLFCSECLDSSLHIDAAKKICPICRQKVEVRPQQANNKFGTKQKAFYPLELKMMTRKTLGKRPSR